MVAHYSKAMRRAVPAALALTFSVIAAGSASAQANRPSLAELQQADLRVATIGLRLLTANAPRCNRQMPATGLILHSLAQYGAASRDLALATWTFPRAVSIEAIVPGSAAARAGLQPGDGLVGIAGAALPESPIQGTPSSALRDAADERIASLPAGSSVQLTVSRSGQEFDVVLDAPPACRTRLEVVSGSSVRARSDGKVIQLGEQFAAQLDDDAIAVALAHELAHTILDHRQRIAALEQAKRPTRSAARQFEDEADLLSLHLLALAGWDPAIAPRFMRREGRRFDPLFSGQSKHRSGKDRAQRMEDEIARMKAIGCALPADQAAKLSLCLPRAG